MKRVKPKYVPYQLPTRLDAVCSFPYPWTVNGTYISYRSSPPKSTTLACPSPSPNSPGPISSAQSRHSLSSSESRSTSENCERKKENSTMREPENGRDSRPFFMNHSCNRTKCAILFTMMTGIIRSEFRGLSRIIPLILDGQILMSLSFLIGLHYLWKTSPTND